MEAVNDILSKIVTMLKISRKLFYSTFLLASYFAVAICTILLSGCDSEGSMSREPQKSLKVEIEVSPEFFQIGDTVSIALRWKTTPDSMEFGDNAVSIPFVSFDNLMFSDTLTVITWPTDSLTLIPEDRRSLSIISSFYSPDFYENPDPKKRRIEVSEKYNVVRAGWETFRFEQDSDFYAVDTFAYEANPY